MAKWVIKYVYKKMPRLVRKNTSRLSKLSSTSGEVEVSTLNYQGGTYTRNQNGLVVVTTTNNHGFTNVSKVYIKFVSGEAVSKVFNTINVTGTKSFTVQDTTGSPTSGDILVSRILFQKSGSYIRDSHYGITINISAHGFVGGLSIYANYTSGTANSGPAIIEKVINASSFKILKKADPGGFYTEFGVSRLHGEGIYGAGVKVYVIDEGFNDIDPNTPGIQTTSDLAEFTMVNISDSGAGGGGLSHGGLVCALLGASRKNGAGIIGICPDSTLYLADVDNVSGDIFISSVASAIDDAISKGVDIINISLGTSSSVPAMQQAVQRAINAGIIIFASAGNSGSVGYEYPASYPGVISVGSVNIKRRLSSFNTRNEKVALFAPGEKYPLPSPVDVTDVVYVDGTSFSSPFAAGMASLFLSKRRRELGDPAWKPSREELISALAGGDYLNTSELSYNTPVQPASDGGMGVFLGVAFVILLLVLIFGWGMRRRVPERGLEYTVRY